MSCLMPPNRSQNSSAVRSNFTASTSAPSLWFNGKRISNLLIRTGRLRNRTNRVRNPMLIEDFPPTFGDFEDLATQPPDDARRRQQVVALDAVLVGRKLD